MTVNEHQSNVSFCCEMSWGLMRNLAKKRKEQAVLKLLKIFAVWEILIETGYFFLKCFPVETNWHFTFRK